MKYDKGFSLMELLIVLAVVAILTGIGVPTFIDTIENNQLRSASEELYQRLFAARSQSVNEQKTLFISFSPGTTWCFGINSTNYCNCAVPTSCDTGTVTSTNSKITMSITGFANNQNQVIANKGMFAQAGNVAFSLSGKVLPSMLHEWAEFESVQAP